MPRFKQPTCPKCGSTEITLGGGTECGRSLVALYLLAVPVPTKKGGLALRGMRRTVGSVRRLAVRCALFVGKSYL